MNIFRHSGLGCLELQSMLKGNLRRTFTLFDLIMIGIGITIGSGIFLLTGLAQALYVG